MNQYNNACYEHTMGNSISRFFMQGKIPSERPIRLFLLISSGLVVIYAIVQPMEFKKFGEFGFYLLFFILFIRPFATVFPDFDIFRKLVAMRRQFGILCGSLLLAHGLGFFLNSIYPLHKAITQQYLWNPKSFYFWGIMGLCIVIPLLITSNNASMKLLKRWWKRLQRLTYLLFFFGTIHIMLIDPENAVMISIFLILLVAVRVLAKRNVSFRRT